MSVRLKTFRRRGGDHPRALLNGTHSKRGRSDETTDRLGRSAGSLQTDVRTQAGRRMRPGDEEDTQKEDHNRARTLGRRPAQSRPTRRLVRGVPGGGQDGWRRRGRGHRGPKPARHLPLDRGRATPFFRNHTRRSFDLPRLAVGADGPGAARLSRSKTTAHKNFQNYEGD